MRIVIDYTPALRQGAGIGRYTRGLVNALRQIDSSNEYTLLCAGSSPEGVTWPGNFRVQRVGLSARWLTVMWHRLGLPFPVEWLAGPCDIYHSPDFTLPPLRSARGVVTIHDLSFLRVPQYADPGLRAYLQAAVPRSAGRATRVLTDSQCTMNDVIDLLGVPAKKIDVVPAGVDEIFRPVRDAAQLDFVRARYHLPDWFILSVGTLEPRKNLSRLITAYALMRRQAGLPHHLVIAGRPGWLYQEIYAQVECEMVQDSVHFIGYVDDVHLPALYTLADLFAFPSLYEGFGIPPLEAMACATPVVTSRNSSLPEAAGTAALLVDAEDTEQIADAMARILGNPSLRATLVEFGLEQAARFPWSRAATALLKAYERAAGG